MRPTAELRVLAIAVVLLAAFAGPAAGAPVWTLADHPQPPPGAEFKVPLGMPGDLQFWAPNRGLLAIEGNSTVRRGLLRWNGESWAQLATVCGGPGDTTRIAWAGPREFWTVTEPSLPRTGSGLALCRFRDGEVVASYSTPEQSADPYRRMNAATCVSANDCWFGGVHTADATGERQGAFLLHWDGAGLSTVYYRQGRGISDLEGHQGAAWLSTVVGRQVDSRQGSSPQLDRPEDRPHLLHRIDAGGFTRDPFTPADLPDTDPLDGRDPPADVTDLLALDSDGTRLWGVGGGTTSGAPPEDPDGPAGRDMYDRQPVAGVFEPGGAFRELPLDQDFEAGERFVDVAAVPGAPEAWIAVQRFLDRRSTSARAKVARIDASGAVREVLTLPQSGSGRGAAARIAFTSPTDGWVVTTAGWLLHFTDGARPPRDDDPAFNRLVDFRPNEAAAQFIPDAPPVDDSQLFAPPPVELEQAAAPATTTARARRLPALLRNVRSRLKGRRRLVISFRLVREARIGVVGRRGRRIVARAKARTVKPGNRRIVVRLDPKRPPTRISFSIRETGPDAPQTGGGAEDTGAGSGDTVTTGGATNSETVTTGGGR